MLSAIRPPIIADLFICNVSIRLNPADGNDVDVAKGVYTKENRIFIREYSLENYQIPVHFTTIVA